MTTQLTQEEFAQQTQEIWDAVADTFGCERKKLDVNDAYHYIIDWSSILHDGTIQLGLVTFINSHEYVTIHISHVSDNADEIVREIEMGMRSDTIVDNLHIVKQVMDVLRGEFDD